MKEVIKQLLQISDVSYYRWRKERPIFDLLESYFTKDELEEFLKTGKIEKMELIKNLTLDSLQNQVEKSPNKVFEDAMEDYIVINIKRFYKMDRNKFFNLFFPSPEFITRHLKQLETIITLNDLTIENARQKFIEFIQKVPLNKFLDSEKKREKILQEIDLEYADIELYVILKHRRKFI